MTWQYVIMPARGPALLLGSIRRAPPAWIPL